MCGAPPPGFLPAPSLLNLWGAPPHSPPLQLLAAHVRALCFAEPDGFVSHGCTAGDHLYRMDYREFVAAHRAAGADITVAALPCAEEQAQAFGLMKIDDRWARRRATAAGR